MKSAISINKFLKVVIATKRAKQLLKGASCACSKFKYEGYAYRDRRGRARANRLRIHTQGPGFEKWAR